MPLRDFVLRAFPPQNPALRRVAMSGFVLLLLLLAALCGPPAAARADDGAPSPPSRELRFDRLSTADGLSFSLATSALQDRHGFMWFGTEYGLNKYDGTAFTVYPLDSEGPDLLYGNRVRDLHEDRAGNLWIVTVADLVRRDAATGSFIHYGRDAGGPRGLGSGTVLTVGEDASGRIWIGTQGGVIRYDLSADTSAYLLQDHMVLCICRDRSGGMWVGTAGGLWHYAPDLPEGGTPARYRFALADPAGLSSDIITAIREDRDGALWVGTVDGLNRLDRATGKVTRYRHAPDDPNSLSDDVVTAILEDAGGRLWIGTGNGLNVFDRAAGRFDRYRFDPADPHSLSSDLVQDIYQDRSGVVWIVTAAGINKVNETASRFVHYGVRAGPAGGEAGAESTPGLSDKLLSAVYQDSRGIVWIGTSTGGLNRLDRSAGSITVYRNDPTDPSSIPYGEVEVIYEDRAGTLWVGTAGGLGRFDPATETFVSERAFRGRVVTGILEDPQGNLWVGYFGGLLRRERGASTFTDVPQIGYRVAASRVGYIYLDGAGDLWVSTQDDGLFRLSGAEGGADQEVTHFSQRPGDPQGPGASPVIGFYEDARGTLWMGSIVDGLVRYDRDSGTFARFLPDTGPVAYVSCVLGDAAGFLWMGTREGLARFDPRTETFSYFDARDGLVIGEGMRCFGNEEGEMFFGSLQGLNTFFPARIRDNLSAPAVVITALNVGGRVLRADLPAGEQVVLSHRDNYLSFDFAALDYAAPAKNRYAYMMEGLDAGWVQAGTRRHADYPALRPGSYTFRVKASNNSGVWNEQGAAVRITITPPFWESWWFLSLVVLALVGTVAGGVRLRVMGAEKRTRELERQVGERTAALEQKTQELQQLYQKSRELAVLEERSRLARELHDAVTQTLFSASLVAEALPSTWDRDRDAGRSLLQQLRGLSRGALAEMRTLLLELRPAALVETRLDELLRQLAEAASGREGIPVAVQVEGEGRLPPDVHIAFYRIAQEALNNVVKHARARQATVRLNHAGSDGVLLSIADDGRGFDPARVPHDRLGLGIMGERAQSIGAHLTVESQPRQGTQVTMLWEKE